MKLPNDPIVPLSAHAHAVKDWNSRTYYKTANPAARRTMVTLGVDPSVATPRNQDCDVVSAFDLEYTRPSPVSA